MAFALFVAKYDCPGLFKEDVDQSFLLPRFDGAILKNGRADLPQGDKVEEYWLKMEEGDKEPRKIYSASAGGILFLDAIAFVKNGHYAHLLNNNRKFIVYL